MRLTYSSQAKMAYLHLTDIADGDVAKTVHVDHEDLNTPMVFDLDAQGRILGIEFLHAKGLAPAALDSAER